MTGKIERQLVTSGIKHWGLSGYSSILPRIKFGVTGQDSSPQSPTISYRQPLPVMLKKRQCNNKTAEKMYRNANASAKSKELQPDTQPDTVAAHLLLPQPHIKPSALTNDYFINLISRQYAI